MISKKKVLQASHADFLESFRWAPFELMGPLLGPLKPGAFLKPTNSPKSMGPGVIVSPCLPLSVALYAGYEFLACLNVRITFLSIMRKNSLKPVSSSSGNAFVSGAGSPEFNFWNGQIGYCVAYGSPPLQHFFERSCAARRSNDAEMAPQTRYTLRRNTASIIERFNLINLK